MVGDLAKERNERISRILGIVNRMSSDPRMVNAMIEIMECVESEVRGRLTDSWFGMIEVECSVKAGDVVNVKVGTSRSTQVLRK